VKTGLHASFDWRRHLRSEAEYSSRCRLNCHEMERMKHYDFEMVEDVTETYAGNK
jgi:hypothetical protein